MGMTNQEIVQKLWNECNVLRDDGVSYQDYITELTYILFLKMSKEQGQEDDIPEKYRWDSLVSKEGLELKNFYRQLYLIWVILKLLRVHELMRFMPMLQLPLTNQQTWKRLSKILMNLIGSQLVKKVWVIFTKA